MREITPKRTLRSSPSGSMLKQDSWHPVKIAESMTMRCDGRNTRRCSWLGLGPATPTWSPVAVRRMGEYARQLTELDSALAASKAREEEKDRRIRELEFQKKNSDIAFDERNEAAAEWQAKAESLESERIDLKMVPGPCPMCGSPSTYDGIAHRVSCDNQECQHYFDDPGMNHETVIRNWNRLPSHEVKLAMQRAEMAEQERDTALKRLAESEARVENALEWLDTSKDKPYWRDYTKAQLVELIEGAREALNEEI